MTGTDNLFVLQRLPYQDTQGKTLVKNLKNCKSKLENRQNFYSQPKPLTLLLAADYNAEEVEVWIL
jgi:hypothetical protein